MRAHEFDPWDDRYDPFCRLCGQRAHVDLRPAALVRDALIGGLLGFFLIVSMAVGLWQ